MRPSLSLVRLMVAVFLSGVVLGGCGNSSAPSVSAEDKIKGIQDNDSLPPSVKATAIAAEKAKQGSSPTK